MLTCSGQVSMLPHLQQQTQVTCQHPPNQISAEVTLVLQQSSLAGLEDLEECHKHTPTAACMKSQNGTMLTLGDE